MTKKIVIIGGGIAGLATAYYLRKQDNLDITILEASDRLGGRLHTEQVHNSVHELGGFIVFPWYKHTQALLRNLNIHRSLVKLKHVKELFWDTSVHRFVYLGKVPLRNLFLKSVISHPGLLKSIRKKALYKPNLNSFNGATAAQLLKRIGASSKEISTIGQVVRGYCYGNLDQLPASLYIGFLGQFIFGGGFSKAQVMPRGIGTFIEAIENELLSSGIQIRTSERAMTTVNGEVHTNNSTYQADIVVYANGPPKHLVGDTLSTIYYSVSGTLNKPFVDSWTVAYPELSKSATPKLTSIGQSHALAHSLHRSQFLACISVGTEHAEHYAEIDIRRILDSELAIYFPGYKVKAIQLYAYWPNTMPIVTEKQIDQINRAQGKGNTYYVGDYFSAPCIETAIYSAKSCATSILAGTK